ncbi:recombinase family protein [Frankia sp. CNm7]|uniref:Recombinase family protein n=1 Tax=Frankia nepalensis TaxID=1836974 RepID=A0A937RH83_9ACTN|nr:recombinase family protein [Frankia nepalensis]MBL7498296.1 recombinase family protein [Frankia nepalensis]MBL7509112.1 recombinase family protein [Frankia nepalensis]MBL7520799.1 recombinase family protein [Frankia nepalensis]MBL7630157.1 recombinase family protein [Frankia nepalensis]
MAQPAPRPQSHPTTPADPSPGAAPAFHLVDPTPRPAYGYLAVPDDDEDQINSLHARLATHATDAGLTLLEVYVDRDTTPTTPDRPGLEDLLAELAHHPGAVLLVPGPSHLPATPTAHHALTHRLAQTRATLRALSTPPPRLPAAQAPHCVPQPSAPGPGLGPLTAEGTFELTLRPDDAAATLISALVRLPADARFVESYGDVATTLVFHPAPDTAGQPR